MIILNLICLMSRNMAAPQQIEQVPLPQPNADFADYRETNQRNTRNQRLTNHLTHCGHAKARPYTFRYTIMKKSLTPRERA